MLGAVFPPTKEPEKSSARQFIPDKELCETDNILVDMLNSQGHEGVSFCVCDPHLADMPIIFASDGFCNFTGYLYNEIEGRNCRFLQGPETKRDEVDRIREAIQSEEERCVNLLNYRKDGTSFVNEFFISPLRDKEKKSQYVRTWRISCCLLSLTLGQLIHYYAFDLDSFHFSLLGCNVKSPRKEMDRCLLMLAGSTRKEITCCSDLLLATRCID